ncbi:MAG: hypothetical protein HYU54_04145 [Actinobacteria bacterium]|nr:hypothetical protein [Actinomycetota bacterium]
MSKEISSATPPSTVSRTSRRWRFRQPRTSTALIRRVSRPPRSREPDTEPETVGAPASACAAGARARTNSAATAHVTGVR